MGDLFISTLLTASAVSFILSAIDSFIDMGKFRGLVSLLLAYPATLLMGYHGAHALISAMASAFLSLTVTFILDNRVTYIPNRRL